MNSSQLFYSLTNLQQEAILVWVDNGFKPSVCADILGITKNSFDSRIKDLRKRIKQAGFPSTVNEGLRELAEEMVAEVRSDGGLGGSAPSGFEVAKVSRELTSEGISRQWVSYRKTGPSDSGGNLEALKAELAADIPRSKIRKSDMGKKAGKWGQGKMAVYVLADVHFGMYAHAAECGEDHDIKISQADVIDAVEGLCDATPSVESAMVLNLGDFFHADSRVPLTPQGKNQLDVDSRFSHVARKGVELMRSVVDRVARKHSKVHIVNVRGNHDPDAAMWLNLIMEAHYGGNDRITVHRNESKVIPFLYGDTALFFYHGEKMTRAHEYITGHPEHRKMHGNATRTYCLAGHIHHETVKTKSNIRFETFSTITGKDAYHADNLYHAIQNMVCITYDQRFGEISRSTIPIERVRYERENS